MRDRLRRAAAPGVFANVWIAVALVAAAAIGFVATADASRGSGRAQASASPLTKELNVRWNEAKYVRGGEVDFRIRRITVGTAWAVQATVINKTSYAFRIDQRLYSFAVAIWTPSPDIDHQSGHFTLVAAQRFVPHLPAVLRPGATWKGVFTGVGGKALPRRTPLRLCFGMFLPVATTDVRGFYWITDHTFRL